MKKTTLFITLLIAQLMLLPLAFAIQVTGVTAEAISVANLRPDPSVNGAPVGEINAGTRYPVVGRSEFFPWVLLGDPATGAPLGWVFQDVVSISGDLNTVPFSAVTLNGDPAPSLSTPTVQVDAPTVSEAPIATPTQFELSGVALSAIATEAPPTATVLTGVLGTVTGEVNVRYGPGVDYPRIGVARQGDIFEVTAYHTQVPWVQIRYEAVSGGFGWLALDLIDVQGDIYSLPSVSRLNFDLPTLTPTPNAVQMASGLPNFTSAPLSPEFAALGDDLWAKLLDQGFEPETSRLGSLFLMDLQTGEAIAFGDDIAYSGMSLSKISILSGMFYSLDRLPDGEEARNLASMMICSENTSSNRILAYIGGDPYSGATTVTNMLRDLGLRETFMVAPFLIDPNITPQPVSAPGSPADQTRTNPDPFNQMTVGEMGWMLYSIYQCAVDGTGPLVAAFGGAFDQRECQQMLYLMRGNKIGALIEVGVPENVAVAHKHGWIDDTHGDAGVITTPGGDYVLVVVLHNPTWLNFEDSFPLIEDISLTVYNYFNPNAPMTATRESNVPETCDMAADEVVTVIDDLMRGRSDF